jgi:UDPglucose 6-dehydrogenase
MRDAPSLDLARWLIERGVKVKGYDPVSMTAAGPLMPRDVKFAEDPYDLADGCDAIILVTEWNEFKQLDFDRIRQSMKTPILIDGRNVHEPETMRALGFAYRGVGRGYNDAM